VSPDLKGMVGQIRQYAQLPLNAVPALTPLARPAPSVSAANAHSAAYNPTPSAGRPAWLQDHLTADHDIEPVPRFAGRRGLDWAVGLIFSGCLSAVVAILFSGLLPLAEVIGTPLLCLLLVVEGRRTRPEWRKAKAARASRRAQLKSLSGAAASMHRMSSEFAKNEQRLEKLLAAADRGRTGIESKRQKEHTTIDRRAASETAGIEQRLRGAEDLKQRAIRDELQRAVDTHVATELRRHNILAEVKNISGLGPSAARALAGYGIVNAADVHVTLVHGSGSYTTQMAYFHLPNGMRTRVEGIGEKKATALQSWRDFHASRAQRSAPTALPAARLIQINQQHAALITRLKSDRDAAHSRAVAAKEALNRQLAIELATLRDQRSRCESERAVARAAYERDSMRLRATAQEYDRASQAAKLERRARRRLSHLHYLRFSLLGF
jgi:predicted flap endonuclease-1-like 5' DNA nuclease